MPSQFERRQARLRSCSVCGVILRRPGSVRCHSCNVQHHNGLRDNLRKIRRWFPLGTKVLCPGGPAEVIGYLGISVVPHKVEVRHLCDGSIGEYAWDALHAVSAHRALKRSAKRTYPNIDKSGQKAPRRALTPSDPHS